MTTAIGASEQEGIPMATGGAAELGGVLDKDADATRKNDEKDEIVPEKDVEKDVEKDAKKAVEANADTRNSAGPDAKMDGHEGAPDADNGGKRKHVPEVAVLGRRERKKTKKYEVIQTTRRRSSAVGIGGKGVKLRDIPNIAYALEKVKAKDEEVEFLHRVLFSSVGQALKRKANIRDFSGFNFESDKDRAKIRDKMAKVPLAMLKKVATLLDIPTTSDTPKIHKDDVIDSLLGFLENPKILEGRVDLMERDAKRRAERAAKKEASKAEKLSGVKKVVGKASGSAKGVKKSIAGKMTRGKFKKAPAGSDSESDDHDDDDATAWVSKPTLAAARNSNQGDDDGNDEDGNNAGKDTEKKDGTAEPSDDAHKPKSAE